MRYMNAASLAFCSLVLVLILGCGEDFSILTGTIDISHLDAVQSSIGVRETTTVEAVVAYSGDETVLMYTWTANGGSVKGYGGRATYVAPSSPGTYVVRLVVSDGVISSEETVEIRVVQQSIESLILDLSTHWPAEAHEDRLAYSVNITRVVGGRVTLHFDVTQDQDNFDVFLTIKIGQTSILDGLAIGAEQPSTAKTTILFRNIHSTKI